MKKLFLTFILGAGLSLTLTGCETVESFSQNVTERTSDFFSNSWFSNLGTSTQDVSQAPLSADCPVVEIVDELRMMTEFSNYASPMPENLISEIRINSIESQCFEEQDKIRAQMTIMMEGRIGPEGRDQPQDQANFAYPYFVAVSDEQNAILAKEVFGVSLGFTAGQENVSQIEVINQTIPKEELQEKPLKLLIGFQLTQEQFEYNKFRMQAEILPVNR